RDPSWRVALGIIYLETGREADARREFEALAADDFAGIREDAVWLLVMSALCEICSGLRDAGRAATLYRMLSPYAARNVVAGAGPQAPHAGRGHGGPQDVDRCSRVAGAA